MQEKKLIELIFQILSQHDEPVHSEQLAKNLHEHPFYIRKLIEDINLDQQYIDHIKKGYYLREHTNFNQYKEFRKVRTSILLNDYEDYEVFNDAFLKPLDNLIRIVGVYYLYQPISSSKTEFLINLTDYRPILQAPMAFIKNPISDDDLKHLKETIHEIKSRQF